MVIPGNTPMHYVPAFLRPLSQINTGIESNVETKVERVEAIQSSCRRIQFRQEEELPHWRYEEAFQGKTLIEHGRKIKVNETVNHPKRHWWIVSNGLFENLEPPLRDHADIFDFLTALNLCIDGPVAFSQHPGQTVSGAYRVQRDALEYRGDLSQGSFPLAITTMNEIPKVVEVNGEIQEVFEMVRTFRATPIESDEEMDIRIALHMYDDALTSSMWTTMSNLFFVCENVLGVGQPTSTVQHIENTTEMDKDEADNWKRAVNRLKHPDKGEVPSLLHQMDLEIPSLQYMRETANIALKEAMKRRIHDREDPS